MSRRLALSLLSVSLCLMPGRANTLMYSDRQLAEEVSSAEIELFKTWLGTSLDVHGQLYVSDRTLPLPDYDLAPDMPPDLFRTLRASGNHTFALLRPQMTPYALHHPGDPLPCDYTEVLFSRAAFSSDQSKALFHVGTNIGHTGRTGCAFGGGWGMFVLGERVAGAWHFKRVGGVEIQ